MSSLLRDPSLHAYVWVTIAAGLARNWNISVEEVADKADRLHVVIIRIFVLVSTPGCCTP